MTTAPRSTADRSFSAPPNEPIGVRQALENDGVEVLTQSVPTLSGNDADRAPVAARTASTVVSAAISRSTRPVGVTSITASSVTIRLHDLQAGERQRAALQNLVAAVLRRVLHRDDHALGAGDQIHGAAHALHHLAGNHPVGEIALLVDLQRAEHGQVDVAAAHHRERVGAAEVRAARQLGDRLLAGVDQIGIDLGLESDTGPTPSMPFSECSVMSTPGGT